MFKGFAGASFREGRVHVPRLHRAAQVRRRSGRRERRIVRRAAGRAHVRRLPVLRLP